MFWEKSKNLSVKFFTLPLDDLVDISNGLDDATSGMSLKEKYDYLKNQLFECGTNHNIKIELRKGKYNEEKISF